MQQEYSNVHQDQFIKHWFSRRYLVQKMSQNFELSSYRTIVFIIETLNATGMLTVLWYSSFFANDTVSLLAHHSQVQEYP